MDAAAELGRNPVSKHQIQPEYGDEQADAVRDCRTRLARPNSQTRTRTGKYLVLIFHVQQTTCRIGNLTRFIYALTICVTIHTVQYIVVHSTKGKYEYTTLLAVQYTPYYCLVQRHECKGPTVSSSDEKSDLDENFEGPFPEKEQ